MFTVGLTGGIGSGKSTVAQLFEGLGVHTLDSDQIAREAVLPDTEALASIVEQFGPDILLSTGELNRPTLRKIIFDAPEQRIWLENLLHPIIHQLTVEKLERLNSPYAVLEIPLLIGRHKNDLIHRILLVDALDNLRIQRIETRDKVSSDLIQSIIATQANRDALITAADDVIVNNHAVDHLKKEVLKLHQKYLQLGKK